MYDTDSTKDVLSKVDWLTTGLRNEITSCFPQKVDIDKKRSNARDPIAFAEKAQKLFPIGRVFLSYKQLDQVAELFCNAWL